MDIQKEAKGQNIPLKIGIHQGEMVMAGGDVMGDGVNIASRLQEASSEGCITISGKVYSDIKNKAGINTKFIGDKKLKGVDDPVKVYEVVWEEEKRESTSEPQPSKSNKVFYYIIAGLVVVIIAFIIWQYLPLKESTPIVEETETIAVDKSIAVLPFINDSHDQENEYFCNGMMEEILTHLQKIADLRVKSRTDVEQYRGKTKTTSVIGTELGVAFILTGSVRKIGNNIHITTQLIDVISGDNLLAETYDGKYTDEIFEFQSNAAKKVATSLQAVLSTEVKDRIEATPTDNMTAYDYYLKGNKAYSRSWNNRDTNIMHESIQYYLKAVELDPNFSLAFTGLGRSYWWLGRNASNINRPELYEKSKLYLKKAIDLDPYNGWAYAEMSVVSITWDWDSTATRKNHDMAIKFMPNDRNVYFHKFWFEWGLRNCEQMIAIQKDIKRFNKNADHPFGEGSLMILSCQKKYSEIARLADEYWGGNISNTQAEHIFFSYLFLNEFKKAEKVISYFKDHNEQKFDYFLFNGLLKAKEGDGEGALTMCDSLKSMPFENFYIALIHAAMGKKNQMYEYLNEALLERESMHQSFYLLPELISCENDAEFQMIKRKIWTPR